MKTTLARIFVALLAILTMISCTGCQSEAQTGATVGALMGAGVGQVLGNDAQSTLAGAAIGGAAGYMLGNEADKEMARAERARIEEDMQYVTLNIHNSNGSISQVRLRKHGVGYLGTRGEYYPTFPTEDQLRPVYGF